MIFFAREGELFTGSCGVSFAIEASLFQGAMNANAFSLAQEVRDCQPEENTEAVILVLSDLIALTPEKALAKDTAAAFKNGS